MSDDYKIVDGMRMYSPIAPERPREWWIIDSLMSGRTWIAEGPLNPDHKEKAHEVHVIEYSAYAALEKENAELRAELEGTRHRERLLSDEGTAAIEYERARQDYVLGVVPKLQAELTQARKERDGQAETVAKLAEHVARLQAELAAERERADKNWTMALQYGDKYEVARAELERLRAALELAAKAIPASEGQVIAFEALKERK
jgi:hypothetical protein